MSETEGRLVVCDVCSETVFEKRLDDGVTDGGFTRWHNFEKTDGWSYGYGFKNLCPKCKQALDAAVEREAERLRGNADG